MFISMPTVVQVRFRRWNEVIKTPEPPASLPLTTTLWHFARGMAFAADGRANDARTELTALRAMKPKIAELKIDPQGGDDARKVGELCDTMLQAAIARVEKNSAQEIALLQQAATLQDSLNYNEPSDWLLPARESLGGALLRAGKPAEAEKVFRDELAREPRNGRALFGLAEALRQQHRASDAAFVEHQFEAAWKDADTKLNVENL
jgi:tetratricopeptide (TPR) repeat protein